MNVLMIAQISSERGGFAASDVAASVADKLVRRHPHVFGEPRILATEQAHQNWERSKLQEQAEKGATSGRAQRRARFAAGAAHGVSHRRKSRARWL